jgi:hypothetical protein
MIAVVVCGCANHREARRKSVQLYPGLAQREVVNLFGMPSKAEGNPDDGNPSGDYASIGQGLEAYPISNTERRMNSCGNMKTSI